MASIDNNEFIPQKYIKFDITQYDKKSDTIIQYLPSTVASQINMHYQFPTDESAPILNDMESIIKDMVERLAHLQSENEVDIITEEELMEIIKKAEEQVEYELSGKTPIE